MNDKDTLMPFPLCSLMELINSLPTTLDQQFLRKYEETKRVEDVLVERVRMAGALHGEVGIALVYRRGGVTPRLK